LWIGAKKRSQGRDGAPSDHRGGRTQDPSGRAARTSRRSPSPRFGLNLATDLDPDTIGPKRVYRRNRYFARNELSRLCLGVLRTAAGELLRTDDIAVRVIATKGFDVGDAILRAAIREQVGSTVKGLHREGAIKNIGAGRASKWKLKS
jgi:hypothetical protein